MMKIDRNALLIQRLSELVAELKDWKPQDRPIQFTEKHNPYNTEGEVLVDQAELDEAAKAEFFTEAYLYNLLGKEDARSLLGRFDKIESTLVALTGDTDERR